MQCMRKGGGGGNAISSPPPPPSAPLPLNDENLVADPNFAQLFRPLPCFPNPVLKVGLDIFLRADVIPEEHRHFRSVWLACRRTLPKQKRRGS